MNPHPSMEVWRGLIVWETSDITKVDLSKNSIETLPDELSSCTSLEIPLTGFQAAFKLQILDLSNNVGCLPEHPVFSCLLQLQELYIKRMRISKGLLEPSLQVLQMFDAYEKNSSLQ
ncbi:plant intracellular Ras-group-related LRR protein 6 isoform X2 [Tanacetum coccineum]